MEDFIVVCIQAIVFGYLFGMNSHRKRELRRLRYQMQFLQNPPDDPVPPAPATEAEEWDLTYYRQTGHCPGCESLCRPIASPGEVGTLREENAVLRAALAGTAKELRLYRERLALHRMGPREPQIITGTIRPGPRLDDPGIP